MRRRGRNSGLLWAAAITIGTVVVVAAAVVLMLYLGRSGTVAPEHSARYYPQDTLAYVWFTLNPGGGQRDQMLDIWDGLNEYPAFSDQVDESQNDFEGETGTDIEEDVLPWLGAEISLGLLDADLDSQKFEVVLTADVRDHGEAEGFLVKWIDYLERQHGANFDQSPGVDFDVWIEEEDGEAYALSDNLLVAATGENSLNVVLERVSGENESSLFTNEDFSAARAALPTRRFTSAYVNVRGVISNIESSDASEYFDSGFYDTIPDWIASSAGWVERGIVFEMVARQPESGIDEPVDAHDIADAPGLMPQDTVAMLALGFDPNVQNWRDALEEYDFSEIAEEIDGTPGLGLPDGGLPFDPANLNLGHVLDLALMGFDVLTGIDLERDFFAHLEGEMVFGIREFDFEAVSSSPESHAVDAAAMLSYSGESEQALEDTLEEFVEWLYSFGEFDIRSMDIGAANHARLVDLDGVAYSPGYVLHNGYLTIGTTENMLEQIVGIQNGDRDTLALDDEYRRVMGHLAPNVDKPSMLLYLDLHSLARLADSDEMELTEGQRELLQEAIGSVAVASVSDEHYSRLKVGLTLFPEGE